MGAGLDGGWALRKAPVVRSTGCVSDESLTSTPETNVALFVTYLEFK